MVKPTDVEMTAIEKTIFYTHKSQEKGHTTPWWGHTGKHQDQSGVIKSKVGKSLYCSFHGRNN